MTARLGLVALGILAALGLAEGVLRVPAALDPRVRFLATGRALRPAVTYATLEEFIAAQAAHITPHQPWYSRWSNAFGFHDEEFVEPKPAGRLRVLAVGDSFTFAPVPSTTCIFRRPELGAWPSWSSRGSWSSRPRSGRVRERQRGSASLALWRRPPGGDRSGGCARLRECRRKPDPNRSAE